MQVKALFKQQLTVFLIGTFFSFPAITVEYTDLSNAAFDGDENLVLTLIDEGDDVNIRDDATGGTALISASVNGHKGIVELLINEGADINAKNNNGSTSLHWASRNGHKEVVKFLISKGVDTSVVNKSGQTALILATQKGHKEIIKLLTKAKKDSEIDLFLLAQSAYKVYMHNKDDEALSLAFASIQIAMEENKNNYKTYFLAGLIANEIRNNAIAPQLTEIYFEEAVELEPNNAFLYYSIAQNLYTKNRVNESIEYYEKALLLENKLLTPKYITILTDAYIKTNQAYKGAIFFNKLIASQADLKFPAYFILTAAYLYNLEYLTEESNRLIKIVLADDDYSTEDKEHASAMLTEASQ